MVKTIASNSNEDADWLKTAEAQERERRIQKLLEVLLNPAKHTITVKVHN